MACGAGSRERSWSLSGYNSSDTPRSTGTATGPTYASAERIRVVVVNWMSGLPARIHTFRLPGVAKGLFTPLYGETATNRRATIGVGVPLCIRDATVIFFALPGGPQRRRSPDRLPR
ncbi:hypothetical protein GCM10010400_34860 [Streptomyces aculeolatus]